VIAVADAVAGAEAGAVAVLSYSLTAVVTDAVAVAALRCSTMVAVTVGSCTNAPPESDCFTDSNRFANSNCDRLSARTTENRTRNSTRRN
jgi:hypothetical protein